MTGTKEKSCYVLMPISKTNGHTREEWDSVYEFIKLTMKSHSYECTRSHALAGRFLKDIIDSICKADLIVADLTDSRSNVLYELGIAHTMTNKVIMVAQEASHIPSDLKSYGVITYEHNTPSGALRFAGDVSKVLSVINTEDQTRAKPVSPVYDALGYTYRSLDDLLRNPTIYMQCTKRGCAYQRYEVRLDGLTHGGGSVENLCKNWEPARFLGIKGYSPRQ